MKSFNFTKKIKNLVVLTIVLSSSSFAFCGEPKTHDQLSYQPNQINQISYPEIALDNKVEGRVIIYFELLNGIVNNISIFQTEDSMLNDAAIKIVNNFSPEYLMKLESTGKTEFLVPVDFDLI